MTNETIYNYEIADHWLSPLFNGDYTGLEDGEETTLHDFLGGLPKHFHYKSPLVGIWAVLDEEGSFAVDEVSGLHANCFKCSLTFI